MPSRPNQPVSGNEIPYFEDTQVAQKRMKRARSSWFEDRLCPDCLGPERQLPPLPTPPAIRQRTRTAKWSARLNQSHVQCAPTSLVAPELYFAAVLPTENDSLLVQDNQPPRNETWVIEFFFRNLTFAKEGAQIGSPGRGASRHIIVARNFYCLNLIAILRDPNDLVKMTGIVPYPFSC